jgi:tetratricopeptide (TPR) repeat protein
MSGIASQRLVLVVLAVLLAPVALAAQTHDLNWVRCRADDPDVRIRGCTDIIEAKQDMTPMIAIAFNNRGTGYHENHDEVHAIQDYERAMALDPTSFRPYINRGNSFSNQGDEARAILDYGRAIELAPTVALAYANRATSYRRLGDKVRAMSDFNRAISLQPNPE